MVCHSMISYACPDARKVLTLFQIKYDQALSHHIMQNFLRQKSNYQLFTTAVCFPTEENWERLDRAFRQFYIEIRFTRYLAKVIWRYARDFRTKDQRYAAHYLTILDQPINQEEASTTHKDQLADSRESVHSEEESLLNQVDDYRLQEALKQLTDKQLKVLNFYYAYHITQQEIAHQLGVSQQSISRTIDTTLHKLRKRFEKLEAKNFYK